MDVYNYIQNGVYVYAIGSKGNTKLNYVTGEWTQDQAMHVFDDEDQVIFKNLKDTKYEVQKK